MKAHDEDGSIAMTMIVAMIATALIIATLAVVENGLRSSRRSGDSANALQVADAGVNAAIQTIAGAPFNQTTAAATGAIGDGSYEFSATRVHPQLWNVTSTGTSHGLTRRIRAQAVADPVFSRPLYVRSFASAESGTILDSYASPTATCTKQGFLTVEDPSDLHWTATGNQANCQGQSIASGGLANGWTHSMDACEVPSTEAEMGQPLPLVDNRNPPKPLTGPGKCPDPPHYRRVTPKFSHTSVGAPRQWNFPCSDADGVCTIADGDTGGTGTFVCSPTNPFLAGKTYYFDTIEMLHGCLISGMSAPPTTPPAPSVRLFANQFLIGASSSGPAGDVINRPRSAFGCPAPNISADAASDAATISGAGHSYCSFWTTQLELNVLQSSPYPVGVQFRKKARFFWGVINAPGSTVEINPPTGPPQLTMWGAILANSFKSGTQLEIHFDDNLIQAIGSGRFRVANWREEGTAS